MCTIPKHMHISFHTCIVYMPVCPREICFPFFVYKYIATTMRLPQNALLYYHYHPHHRHYDDEFTSKRAVVLSLSSSSSSLRRCVYLKTRCCIIVIIIIIIIVITTMTTKGRVPCCCFFFLLFSLDGNPKQIPVGVSIVDEKTLSHSTTRNRRVSFSQTAALFTGG